MTKFEITPSPDSTEITVKIGEESEQMNTLRLDAFIQELARIRAQLAPPVPNDPPMGQPVQAIADPRYWTELEATTGGALLMFRHPGFGWVPLLLPPSERDRLTDYFGKQAEGQASGATIPPGSGLH
jgi:hypothetical protein